MMRAVMWADSGAGVGLGHLARCTAVARQLRRRDVESLLLTPDAAGAAYAASQQAVARVAAAFADAVAAQRTNGSDLMIVDSYRLRDQEWRAARDGAPLLLVFNDDSTDVPACDVVVNGAPGAEAQAYRRQEGTHYLLGAAFFPLREEFRDAPPHPIRERVETVLVTTGGQDIHGLLPLIAATVREVYPGARTTVVIGSAPDHMPEVPGCDIAIAPADYAARVRSADVIVCGAGQTLIEAAASGTPAAALLLGVDQQRQHEAVLSAGACVNAGAWQLARPQLAGALRQALEHLRPSDARQALSRRGRALVDGRGADRIAEAVIACAGGVRQ